MMRELGRLLQESERRTHDAYAAIDPSLAEVQEDIKGLKRERLKADMKDLQARIDEDPLSPHRMRYEDELAMLRQIEKNAK